MIARNVVFLSFIAERIVVLRSSVGQFEKRYKRPFFIEKLLNLERWDFHLVEISRTWEIPDLPG